MQTNNVTNARTAPDGQPPLTPAQKHAITAGEGCTTGLPNAAYTSAEIFQWEREHLFADTWTCIGSACEVAQVGDLKPVSFLGAPLVMVRSGADTVKVFHNVCSHRGNELVWQAGHAERLIQCPYHAWSYDLDGQLVATPHVGGSGHHHVDGLDCRKHGLRAARSAVWMGLVFVNLHENAPPFDTFIAPLQQRLDTLAPPEVFAKLRPAATHGTLTIEFAGNWKLCIENNLESYHLPWVHPDLNKISKLEDHYHFYGGDLFAGQGTACYQTAAVGEQSLPVLAGWRDQIAEYPTLYPNVFLGLHRNHFWTRVIEPVAADCTRDHLQLYYLGEAATADGYTPCRQHLLETWRKVFFEDMGVVQGMQRGRHSPAFTGGVFTPIMDEPSHHFAKWVAAQM